MLYHHGVSAGGRHYTLDVLHLNRDGGAWGSGNKTSGEAWLHIDDETVSAVRHEDVFRGHDDDRADDRCAYLLCSFIVVLLPFRHNPFLLPFLPRVLSVPYGGPGTMDTPTSSTQYEMARSP